MTLKTLALLQLLANDNLPQDIHHYNLSLSQVNLLIGRGIKHPELFKITPGLDWDQLSARFVWTQNDIDQLADKLNWSHLNWAEIFPGLTDGWLIANMKHIDPDVIVAHSPLSKFVPYMTPSAEFKRTPTTVKVFMFKHQLDWPWISEFADLSFSNVTMWETYINWDAFSLNKYLTPRILTAHWDKFNRANLLKNQQLSFAAQRIVYEKCANINNVY